jgi:hypothetical protein
MIQQLYFFFKTTNANALSILLLLKPSQVFSTAFLTFNCYEWQFNAKFLLNPLIVHFVQLENEFIEKEVTVGPCLILGIRFSWKMRNNSRCNEVVHTG